MTVEGVTSLCHSYDSLLFPLLDYLFSFFSPLSSTFSLSSIPFSQPVLHVFLCIHSFLHSSLLTPLLLDFLIFLYSLFIILSVSCTSLTICSASLPLHSVSRSFPPPTPHSPSVRTRRRPTPPRTSLPPAGGWTWTTSWTTTSPTAGASGRA